MEETDKAFLERMLQPVVGQTIWSAIAGPQGDYVLSLEIGDKLPRSMRLANPRLGFLKRTYEGSYGFLIECPWRLDTEEKVVVSYLGLIGRADPPLSDDIRELNDRKIVGVNVRGPAWDLDIHLADSAVLRCFSAEVDVRKKRNNWSYWAPEGPVTIGPGALIEERVETHKMDAPFRRLEALGDIDDDDLDE